MFKSIARVIMTCAAFVIGFAVSAQANSLEWSFDNETYGRVNVEFYSQSRDWRWPGNGEVYFIDPSDGVRTMNLSCRNGEKICYGAWLDNNVNYYWGVGRGGNKGCQNCCYTCGGGYTETIRLISN